MQPTVKHIRDEAGKILLTVAAVEATEEELREFGRQAERDAIRLHGTADDPLALRGFGVAVRSESDVENRKKAVEIAVGRARAAIRREVQPVHSVRLDTRGHTTRLRTVLSWRAVTFADFMATVMDEIQAQCATIDDGYLIRATALYALNNDAETMNDPFSAESRASFEQSLRSYEYVSEKLALQKRFGIARERGR